MTISERLHIAMGWVPLRLQDGRYDPCPYVSKLIPVHNGVVKESQPQQENPMPFPTPETDHPRGAGGPEDNPADEIPQEAPSEERPPGDPQGGPEGETPSEGDPGAPEPSEPDAN